MHRRGFLTGLISALAAPVVLPSTSLMQIRGIVMPPDLWALPKHFFLYQDALCDVLCAQIIPLTKLRSGAIESIAIPGCEFVHARDDLVPRPRASQLSHDGRRPRHRD